MTRRAHITADAASGACLLIQQLFDDFNARRLRDAAALFSRSAEFECAPVRRPEGSTDGYCGFAETWLAAFPDASLAIERFASVGPSRTEVHALSTGTHVGPLDLGTCGIFRPSGMHASLGFRQLFDIRDGRIVFSSMSFDLQNIVDQLVTVDVERLLEHLRRIEHIRASLSVACPEDMTERRNLLHRVGLELDAARHVVRPYYNRS